MCSQPHDPVLGAEVVRTDDVAFVAFVLRWKDLSAYALRPLRIDAENQQGALSVLVERPGGLRRGFCEVRFGGAGRIGLQSRA